MMRAVLVAAMVALSACGQSAQAPEDVAPPVTAATSGAWDQNLISLLPFIDACIAKSPETRTITYAAATGEALVAVRLSGAGGAVDCTVPDHDPSPTYAQISPRRENWAPESENTAIFVRGPGENPGGECYEAPEVRDANGAVVGWMLDPEGC
ncbi:MAG: hypothetical protein JNL81_08705 [Hyphomonadaceae bacterium]|nr:hypothetical protein [Hyphomonadaceae bacterium]